MNYKDQPLAEYVEQTGRTQESIGDEIKVTQGTVSKWLKSKRDIIIRIYSNGKIEAYERLPLRLLGRALFKGKKAA